MSAQVVELQQRIEALQGAPTRLTVPVHPALEGLVQLRTGASYAVDSASLALALAAGASRSGEWVGFAGWGDFGAEAACQWGIDLRRTVLVPEPGELWLEVAAALVDVLKVVVLKPTTLVDPKSASVLDARLRARSSTLVVWGDWPRIEARLSAERVEWDGVGRGRGRLKHRDIRLALQRGNRRATRDVRLP
ncbi:hypothetical protein SFC88_21850 [Nocardioides sp. HM23]|uniref:hypothetical protein n=1 Tax=Nocardioides bizhenqiangii TaxID=3095076 RepID=UPI002ACAEA62|nr:hypothetical protein [Nocardioides sp. HM23]MDZ5620101.1 hypothetical protein [Nocardioides sp. HM23]MDZ5623490.1 hypothetical protein [Nocardioides sp. HM23]